MDRQSLINRSILDNMGSGVMTISPEGRILSLNRAAGEILSIDVGAAENSLLGEVLLQEEGLEGVMQAILNAVYEKTTVHQQVVAAKVGGERRSLTLTTSYLRVESSGQVEMLGVIAIINDITEVQVLRETEVRLAESLKAQHAELQDAYRKIEESNQILASTSQRARISTFSTIGLFLVVGVFALGTGDTAPAPGQAPSLTRPEAASTLIVRPERVRRSIPLAGALEPRETRHVASPVSAAIATMHVEYGDYVTAGQRLLDMDVTELQKRHRQARSAYIKALNHFNEIEDWTNNIEVARARRNISKAKTALDAQANKVSQTAFLLERGLIPELEFESATQQYENQRLDFDALESDLAVVLAKGDEDQQTLAELDLENARTDLESLEAQLALAQVTAPVSGVVLQPPQSGSSGGSDSGQRLEKGSSVSQGERLLAIGSTDRYSVSGTVDEVNVTQIRLGQRVAITGDAFPDLELTGVVAHLSSQAQSGSRRSDLPNFDIRVDIDELDEAAHAKLRLGMSADLEIIVYDSAAALLVPFSAVHTRAGKTWLLKKDRNSGEFEETQIQVGTTTVNRVEVIGGLKAGDEVLVSGD